MTKSIFSHITTHFMKKKQSSTMKYKRGKTEIEGPPEDVRSLIWFDLFGSHFWIVAIVILLFINPAASLLPVIVKLIRSIGVILICFTGPVDLLKLFLSG
jgi:hypothetical protein